MLVNISASEFKSTTSLWCHEKLEKEICVIRKIDNFYEIAIDPPYLQGLIYKGLLLNLDYNPTKSENNTKDIYSVNAATEKARE